VLKEGKLPDYDKPLAHGTEVDLGVPALLPEDYVPDVHQRLILYKRVANAQTNEELRDLKIEFIDRFGLLPEQTERLFDVMRLRQRCEALGVERLELNAGGARIVFGNDPKIDPMVLVQIIQKHNTIYKFDGKQVLRVNKTFAESEEAQEFVDGLLSKLALREAA
jgi:transcription-repair coupling factor (superfamily II helicase)